MLILAILSESEIILYLLWDVVLWALSALYRIYMFLIYVIRMSASRYIDINLALCVIKNDEKEVCYNSS
jgi:hypothetical protein